MEASTDAPKEATADSPSEAGDGEAGEAGIQIARGQYIVDHIAACGDCHTPRDQNGPIAAKYLAGNANFAQGPFGPDGGIATVGSRNLTPDMTSGLGSWTAEQIKTAFRDGVDKDGKALFPIMPYFVLHNMSDEDADAVVAYLQSIPAVSNTIPARSFDVPAAAPPVPAGNIPNPTAPGRRRELRERHAWQVPGRQHRHLYGVPHRAFAGSEGNSSTRRSTSRAARVSFAMRSGCLPSSRRSSIRRTSRPIPRVSRVGRPVRS